MQNVRDKILEQSRLLFARFGLNKTTIDDIAKSVNMGKSSLYYYFKNKQEIFKAVLERELEALEQKLAAVTRGPETPQHKLKNFIVTRVNYLKNHENIRRAIKDDYLSFYDFVIEVRKYFEQLEEHSLKSILKEGIHKGVFMIKDILSATRTIIAAIRGMEYKGKTQEIVSKKGRERMLSVILNGIVKHHARHP